MIENASRYLRTVALLRPEQAVARVRLRTQRAASNQFPVVSERMLALAARQWTRPLGGAGWPAEFLPFDAGLDDVWPPAEELAAGRFTLLGHSRDLGEPADWIQRNSPTLWRYHLHYWDWAWSLALQPERRWASGIFRALYRSWRESTSPGRGDAWAPYVVSLRIWSWCGLVDRLSGDTATASAIWADLAQHMVFLRLHLETDVGGNHLVKNLKALLGAAVAFHDPHGVDRWTGRLVDEVERQILPDGGHTERAPAYHCQVLADLDDVAGLLDAAGLHAPDEIIDARCRMRAWLGSVLSPDGAVPLLNDGYPVPTTAVTVLCPSHSGEEPEPDRIKGSDDVREQGVGLTLLPASGLAVLRADRWRVLADIGLPCPDDLPAHAHADTLSFLLWHDGWPLLVEAGTSTYALGAVRAAERSTSAHNTVVIDGHDSTEVWGAFRAGRRARVVLGPVRCDDAGGRLDLTASHDGYRWLPGRPMHARAWTLDDKGLQITDRVTGAGEHQIDILFHLAAGWRARSGRHGLTIEHHRGVGPFRLVAVGPGTWHTREGQVATGWQRTTPATVVAYRLNARLPVEVHTQIAVGTADND